MPDPEPIDVHAHIVPEGLVGRLQRASTGHAPEQVDEEGGRFLVFSGGRRSGPLPAGMFELEPRIADMDRLGISEQVVSAPPVHFFYGAPADVAAEFASLGNDAILDVCGASGGRLSALVTLPMQDPGRACAELDRVADHADVRGVAIGTAIGTKNHDEPEFEPVWEALERRNLPVLVHPVDVPLERLNRYYLRNFIGNPLDSTIAIASLIFGGVLERHPKLRFGFVHGGGFAPYQIGRFDHGWRVRAEARTVIQRPPSEYFAQLYFDCLTHDDLSCRFLIDRVGADRAMLGSDYLYDMADHDPVASIDRVAAGAVEREAVLHGTAERFLRPRHGATGRKGGDS